jgi:hypothetical protein
LCGPPQSPPCRCPNIVGPHLGLVFVNPFTLQKSRQTRANIARMQSLQKESTRVRDADCHGCGLVNQNKIRSPYPDKISGLARCLGVWPGGRHHRTRHQPSCASAKPLAKLTVNFCPVGVCTFFTREVILPLARGLPRPCGVGIERPGDMVNPSSSKRRLVRLADAAARP